MRKLYVSYTYLDLIEVPDDATHEEIVEIIEKFAPADDWNDIDYSDCNE